MPTDLTPVSMAPDTSVRKKRIWRIVGFFAVLALIALGTFLVKAGYIFNKISVGDGSFFQNLTKSLPGVENKLQGEDQGKVNILLLGMRGADVSGGGLLADTIMVVSLHPKDTKKDGDAAKASMVSIPRDLFVTVPGGSEQRKINAVYALGEERGRGEGLKDMQKIVGDITGLTIPYGMVINFKGFTDLVNAVGGIDVTLDQPFTEGVQFHEPKVCDSHVFTVPYKNAKGQQMYECKFGDKPRLSQGRPTYDPYPLCHNKPRSNANVFKVLAQYPLCYNSDEECGGTFELPAGTSHLDGEKALCYARSRYQSSDFERAKRQQMVIDAIKTKALSLGTLADFGKVNALMDSLGNNVLVNFQSWEMKRLFELYKSNGSANVTHKGLEDSEEGLLYAPKDTGANGYILLPRGDNYDRIKALFQSLP